jgi:hypothetical protein
MGMQNIIAKKKVRNYSFGRFENGRVPRSDLIPGEWIPTTESQTRYLRIEAEYPALVNDSLPYHERLKFWKEKINGQ